MRLWRGVRFIDQIAKSAAGKIQRAPLRLLTKEKGKGLIGKLQIFQLSTDARMAFTHYSCMSELLGSM
jgi:hypothetical protein